MTRQWSHAPKEGDGTKIAVIDQLELHRSLVHGVARGLRDGTGIALLDGYAAHITLEQVVFINERKSRLEHLRKSLGETKRLARKARKLAASESDPDVAQGYQADAREHAQSIRRLESEIEGLEEVAAGGDVLPEFDAEVDYLLYALSGLVTRDGKLTVAQRAALKSITHRFEMEVQAEAVHWHLELLVPANGRVLVLGPFTGAISKRGKTLAPAQLSASRSTSRTPGRRREIVRELLAQGYPDFAATAASHAPGDFLADALLGCPVQWPDCPKDFDHEAFSLYLRSAWRGLSGWAPKIYLFTAPKRQALVDLVAHLGGEGSMRELDRHREAFGLTHLDLYNLSVPTGRSATTLPWPPGVRRLGDWSRSSPATDSVLSSLRCPSCGRPATAVVRVPEVPDALLCRACRVMPSRPDVQFPPLYVDLALPSRYQAPE